MIGILGGLQSYFTSAFCDTYGLSLLRMLEKAKLFKRIFLILHEQNYTIITYFSLHFRCHLSIEIFYTIKKYQEKFFFFIFMSNDVF